MCTQHGVAFFILLTTRREGTIETQLMCCVLQRLMKKERRTTAKCEETKIKKKGITRKTGKSTFFPGDFSGTRISTSAGLSPELRDDTHDQDHAAGWGFFGAHRGTPPRPVWRRRRRLATATAGNPSVTPARSGYPSRPSDTPQQQSPISSEVRVTAVLGAMTYAGPS